MEKHNNSLDLGWGNPYFLLENLNKISKKTIAPIDHMDVVYEPDEGNEQLLDMVRLVTERLTGNKYRHYLITNGATQAINTVMRVWSEERALAYCVTGKLGYPFYPGIIEKNGIWRKKVNLNKHEIDIFDEMVLIDSPSNPLGEQYGSAIYTVCNPNVVWDAVYHNPIYNANMLQMPNHEVYINSFSKLLGMTGARVGWLATNDHSDYELFKNESLHENATVSQPSQKLVLETLKSMDLESFMTSSKIILDRNRDIVSKVADLIGTDVQEVGMFYCSQVDNKMLSLLDRCKIRYVTFDSEGDKFVRLNIGQTSDILLEAVKRIKKEDRSK